MTHARRGDDPGCSYRQRDESFRADVLDESSRERAMLGIKDWFDWQAFEDVPESYLRSM